MEIVLLGTGAALPTKSRCTSATALIRLGEILLFDCGEGTQVQFQKAQLKPGKLSRIFISHFHEMGYRLLLHKEPPIPYVIAHLDHVDKIDPENKDLFIQD